MYIVSEPNYATTNWYQNSVAALKNQARKKRVSLTFAEDAAPLDGERCALVLGASASWIVKTLSAMQTVGCHPILINELPDDPLSVRYSCVKTDYRRFMDLLSSYFSAQGRSHTAFYGMNHASFSDLSRKNAFLACFQGGAIFENNGSLSACFADFSRAHAEKPFDSVICANDFAAVSLLNHLRSAGMDTDRICIAVHSNAQLLTRFPEILAVGVDYPAVASAAFEIADCICANPSFAGMRITVDPSTALWQELPARTPDAALPADAARYDPIYTDGELSELMRIEKLLSACDETDLEILRHLAENCNAIGESTFLSDNGVKYRIKKMKKICNVTSKSEIPPLLSKYGVEI
ncbi:MAG: hypothetical protein IJW30_06505 [Clostridia bacterium]|nr:hypothetical protein [Clostridia bacterium]MBQ9774299.1 hypothetical protein [Clostridia bacterium]